MTIEKEGVKKRGGKRPGAGRPLSEYKTVTISFRVREAFVEEIKEVVKDKINSLIY